MWSIKLSILFNASFLPNISRVRPSEGDLVDPVRAIRMGWFTFGTGQLFSFW